MPAAHLPLTELGLLPSCREEEWIHGQPWCISVEGVKNLLWDLASWSVIWGRVQENKAWLNPMLSGSGG